jgi:hypothetical protein
MADFDRARKLSLGVKADLSDRRMLPAEVLERAERESILVF